MTPTGSANWTSNFGVSSSATLSASPPNDIGIGWAGSLRASSKACTSGRRAAACCSGSCALAGIAVIAGLRATIHSPIPIKASSSFVVRSGHHTTLRIAITLLGKRAAF